MQTHKFQINVLNVITIDLQRTALIIVTTVVLLVINFLTENGNKLNENPKQHTQIMYSTTNCTPVDQFNINKSSNDANSNDSFEKNSKHPTDSNKMLESIINRKDTKSYQFNLKHSRDRLKRFLIYSGSGVCKLVIGFSIPVKLPDKRRSMGNYLGFHFQFPEITRPIYWWDFFNSTTFAARQLSWQVPLLHNNVRKLLKRDESREYIYKFIQNIFEHRGLNGEQCLYQLICEIGKRPFAVDKTHNPSQIYHEFLNAIFIPPKLPTTDKKYIKAHLLGKSGGDCDVIFNACPNLTAWLRKKSLFFL